MTLELKWRRRVLQQPSRKPRDPNRRVGRQAANSALCWGFWRSHPGEHPALVDRELFEAVQAQLTSAAVDRQGRARSSVFILAGLLYDDAGNRMSPSHTRKDEVRYRYYVSQALQQHRKARAGSVARISAPEVEAAVTGAYDGRD